MNANEKEIVIECGGRSYGKAALQDLIVRHNKTLASNVTMTLENKSLKRQIGGLKTSNANYREQVKKLKEQVELYKSLDIEGDELYEEQIAKCDSLKKELDSANVTIGELRGQIESYNNQILIYRDRIEAEQLENKQLRKAIECKSTPWWKKIF